MRQIESITLIKEDQNFTNAWVDLGEPIRVQRTENMAIFMKYLVNDSTGLYLRAVAMRVANGDEFLLPIKTILPDYIAVKPGIINFPHDTDYNIVFPFEVDGAIPFIQMQIKATIVGATPGVVSEAYASIARGAR